MFDALELFYAQETSRIAARLAHLAGVASRAVDQVRYLGSAAERESRLGAFERAGRFAESGLRLFVTLAGSRNLPQLAAGELRLLFAKGVSIMARFGYADPRLGEIFEAARRLSKQHGDLRAHAGALYGLWSFQLMDGRPESSRKTAQACLRHVQRHGLRESYLLAHYALGTSLVQLGRLTEGLRHLEKAVTFRDRVRSGSSLRDERVTAQCQLARVRWLVGFRQEALEAAQQALKIAEADKQPEGIAYALFFVADIFHFQRDALRTREALAKLRELPGEREDAQKLVWAIALRAWAYGAKRGSRRAIRMFRQTLEEDAKYGPRAGHTKMRVVLAELLLRNGSIGEALAELRRASKIVVTTGERYFAPEISRVRGECALALGRDKESLIHFKKATAEARKMRARSLELRSLLSASGLLDQDHHSELTLQTETLCRRFLPPLLQFFIAEPSTGEIQQARQLWERLNTSNQNIKKPAKSSGATSREESASSTAG
jgi:tetratricopeptide (TPR) repeat protein